MKPANVPRCRRWQISVCTLIFSRAIALLIRKAAKATANHSVRKGKCR